MNLIRYIVFIVVCELITGCSTIRKNTIVVDATIRNDQCILLLYADNEFNRGWLQPEGISEEVLNNAFGIGVCGLTNRDKQELVLTGKRDSSSDGYFLNSSWPGSRLCGPESYLIPGLNDQIKQFQFTDKPKKTLMPLSSDNSRQFLADRFCLSPSIRTIVGCYDKPFAIDSNTLQPLHSIFAEQCANIICEYWTNRLNLEQIAAVSDDLKAFAVQTKMGVGWHQFTIWNLERGDKPRIVKVEGDIINLQAVQLVEGKVWILYSSVIGGAGSSGHDQAKLVDEDGNVLGKTEMYGGTFLVDENFNRIACICQEHGNSGKETIYVQIWYPRQDKKEVLSISADKACKELYSVWRK